jgi:hypothetical protein
MTPELEACIRRVYPTGKLLEPRFGEDSYDTAKLFGTRLREVLTPLGFTVDSGDIHPQWRFAIFGIVNPDGHKTGELPEFHNYNHFMAIRISRVAPYIMIPSDLKDPWYEHLAPAWHQFLDVLADVCREVGVIEPADELYDLEVPFVEWEVTDYARPGPIEPPPRPARVEECLFDDDDDQAFYDEAKPLLGASGDGR